MSSSFQDNKHGDLDYRLFENPNQKWKSTWIEKLIYWLNVAGSFIHRHLDKIRLWFVILWILISFALNWKSGTIFAFNYPTESNVEDLSTNDNIFESVLISNSTDGTLPDVETQSNQTQFGWKLSHIYMEIANLLFVISNIQMDILYLRLFLITANLFIFLWGGLVLSTALDVVLYASLNLVLNVAFSIPLIIQRIPIKFDVEIEEIYTKWFSGYMSKGDFKKLNETRIKRRSHPGTKIVTEGNPFESLYLFTRIPNDAKVIISCQNKKISSVREGSWVCVPEMLQAQEKYIEYENKRKKIDKTKGINLDTSCFVNHGIRFIKMFWF